MKSITIAISPGRSGTQLLHSLLMQVPGMNGDHENENYPSFATVRQKNLTDRSAGREYIKNALKRIEQLPGKYYSITDLSSSYGPIEHYLELGIKPNVIFLHRDAHKVAASYFMLDFIIRAPSVGIGWNPKDWYPFPGEQDALPISNPTKLHSYQIPYWVCCDNAWRARRYRSILADAGCKMWDTSIPQMLNLQHFNSMLEHFELPSVNSVKSEVVDVFAEGKKRELPPREFLYKLELDVLDRIPVEVKQYLLEQGWGQL